MIRIGPRAVVVVTGAASGIGRAIAVEADRRGARVALVDVDRAGLEAVGATSSRSSLHVCDVADAGAVGAAARAVVERHGQVHVLINNAGVSVAGPIEQLTLAGFQWALGVNFWGVVHGCQAFLPHLRAVAARDGAAICTVLSAFALFSLPTKAAYAASKHAARAFTEALAAELYGSGISVTAAYPGATATAIAERGLAVDEDKRAREAKLLERGMPAEVVARKILRAVERGRPRVLIGRDTRALDLASRLAPSLFQLAVRRFWRRIPFL